MSNSSLVEYRNLTHNYSKRTGKICKITIHHAAGKGTAKSITDSFLPPKRKASANYIIGYRGDIGQAVLEENRAWTSRSAWNDDQAVTIEVSNNGYGEPWGITDDTYSSLIDLCVDICQRNHISMVNYTGDKNGVLTEHRMFVATACPGTTIHELLRSGKISKDINDRLNLSLASPVDGEFVLDGINYSPVFDPSFYGAKYPDLGRAGLITPTQLFQHFTTYGMNEFRQGCASFDPVAYWKGNEDLQMAFDDDREAYYKHYLLCGKQEIEDGKRKGC